MAKLSTEHPTPTEVAQELDTKTVRAMIIGAAKQYAGNDFLQSVKLVQLTRKKGKKEQDLIPILQEIYHSNTELNQIAQAAEKGHQFAALDYFKKLVSYLDENYPQLVQIEVTTISVNDLESLVLALEERLPANKSEILKDYIIKIKFFLNFEMKEEVVQELISFIIKNLEITNKLSDEDLNLLLQGDFSFLNDYFFVNGYLQRYPEDVSLLKDVIKRYAEGNLTRKPRKYLKDLLTGVLRKQ